MDKNKKIKLDTVDKKILTLLQENADINISKISKEINLPIVAFVQVKTNQHNLDWAKKFIKVVEELEEVVEFYRLSGSIDYLLKIVVPSVTKFDEFYQDLTSKIDLTDVTTSFSMDEIKHTNKLPLKYI